MTDLQRERMNAINIELIIHHVGKSRAIGAGALAAKVFIRGKSAARRVRELIHQLRKEGNPICSDNGLTGGYYYPADKDEARAAMVQLKKHALAEFAACVAIERGMIARFGEQLSLGLGIYEHPHDAMAGPRFTMEEGRQ